MKRIGLLVAIAISAGLAAGSPAAARNYDCSKPGNANKAACKTQAAKPAPAAASKAVAKATPAAKPAPAAKTAAARNYDCAKPGNANKAACKGAATAAAAPAPARMAATRPAAAKPAARDATTSARPAAAQVAGAVTAQCKDGTLSHAANRSGACSRHGGVAAWR